MSVKIVRPHSGRLESAVLALATLAVVLGTVGYALTRHEHGAHAPLLDWQLNAFENLGPTDQAIHSALVFASVEISWTYQEEAVWPTVEELRGEYMMPPFQHDVFWKRHGEVAWELHLPLGEQETAQGATIYFGHGGKAEGQGAYLMVHRHSHAGFNAVNSAEIWLHPDPEVARPRQLKADSLIRDGWKQVITYSGADELERLRG